MESACNSLTRLAEARARSRAVLKDKSLREISARGLKRFLRQCLQHHGEVLFRDCSSSNRKGTADALHKPMNKGVLPHRRAIKSDVTYSDSRYVDLNSGKILPTINKVLQKPQNIRD